MAFRRVYSLGHSEFNGFLFSLVGEEKNGNQLTVLSALARLGLDPWGEAARLSKLKKEAAISTLAAAIATLPEGDWTVSDSRSIAACLVARLPGHGLSSVTSSADGGVEDQKPESSVWKWLTWIAVGLAVIVVLRRLFGG